MNQELTQILQVIDKDIKLVLIPVKNHEGFKILH